MTDLTDKWKKGELPEGWYFVKLYDRLNIIWLEYDVKDGFFGYYGNHVTDYEIEQILAQVPSYGEWENICIDNTDLRQTRDELDCAVTELREKVSDLEETNEALNAELKEVCDVLIRKCPEMKDWVMMNWKNLYEVQDENI